MVQRKAARFGTGDYRTTSIVTQMLEALQCMTKLQQRRKRASHHALLHCKPSCCDFTRTISYTEGCSTSCNNVAPVTNLCLGRATTRFHSSQWSKKKLQLKHKNSLFTLQTFHYNYY
jgi:hypothetical protein